LQNYRLKKKVTSRVGRKLVTSGTRSIVSKMKRSLK